MLEPVRAARFKREYRLMEKRRKDMSKFEYVSWLIINEQPLPPKYEDHPLRGKWDGCRECHIEPDWLLVYETDRTLNEVRFYRTGSHADLF